MLQNSRLTESVDRSWCSHTRTTVIPCLRSSRATRLPRILFQLILSPQYSRFAWGIGRRHFGQPCQKQPSIKMTRSRSGKKKSGAPTIERGCILQPRIPRRMSAARNLHSVDRLPLERTLLMRSLLSSLLNISMACPVRYYTRSIA